MPSSLRVRVPAQRTGWLHGWLALAVTMAGCGDSASQTGVRGVELERVVAACVEAMVRSTCQVMNGPAAAAQTASVVFVAGVGPVDAVAYRELRASGETMCQVVRTACDRRWDGAQCKTARGLWPATQ